MLRKECKASHAGILVELAELRTALHWSRYCNPRVSPEVVASTTDLYLKIERKS